MKRTGKWDEIFAEDHQQYQLPLRIQQIKERTLETGSFILVTMINAATADTCEAIPLELLMHVTLACFRDTALAAIHIERIPLRH